MKKQNIIRNFITPLLIISLSWILFNQVSNFEYVWDDLILFINDNSLREGIWSWNRVSRPVLEGTYYFRPLVFTSFIYEFKFTHAIPYYSHLINLFIFSINTVLVYLFFTIYLSKLNVKNFYIRSLVGAFIYLIHPVQIESFAWVSGRFDLFATFFCLCGLICYFSIKKNIPRAISVSLLWLCALFSKESALLLPAIIFCLELALSWSKSNFNLKIWLNNTTRKNIVLIVLSTCIFIFYLILRNIALHGMLEGNWLGNNNLLFRIWLSLYTLGYYLQLVFAPFFSMGGIYSFTMNENFNVYGHIRVALTLLILIIVVYGIYKRNNNSLFILTAIIALFLVLQTVTLMMPASSIVCDRFLNFPLIFFILFIITLNIRIVLPKPYTSNLSKAIINIIGIFWLTLSMFTTLTTLPMWKDNLTLWAWQYSKNPNGFAKYPYLSSLISQQYLAIAYDFFKSKGISNLDAYEQIYYAIYLSLKNNQDAIPYFKGAIQVSPPLKEAKKYSNYQYNALTAAYINLGLSYIKFNNDWEKAKPYFQDIVQDQPNNSDASYMLSLVYHHEKQYSLANKYYLQARNTVYQGSSSNNEKNYWISLQRICKNKEYINYKGCSSKK